MDADLFMQVKFSSEDVVLFCVHTYARPHLFIWVKIYHEGIKNVYMRAWAERPGVEFDFSGWMSPAQGRKRVLNMIQRYFVDELTD